MKKLILVMIVVVLAVAGCSKSLWRWPGPRMNFPAQRIELEEQDGSLTQMWFVPYCQDDKFVWAILGPVEPDEAEGEK